MKETAKPGTIDDFLSKTSYDEFRKFIYGDALEQNLLLLPVALVKGSIFYPYKFGEFLGDMFYDKLLRYTRK